METTDVFPSSNAQSADAMRSAAATMRLIAAKLTYRERVTVWQFITLFATTVPEIQWATNIQNYTRLTAEYARASKDTDWSDAMSLAYKAGDTLSVRKLVKDHGALSLHCCQDAVKRDDSLGLAIMIVGVIAKKPEWISALTHLAFAKDSFKCLTMVLAVVDRYSGAQGMPQVHVKEYCFAVRLFLSSVFLVEPDKANRRFFVMKCAEILCIMFEDMDFDELHPPEGPYTVGV